MKLIKKHFIAFGLSTALLVALSACSDQGVKEVVVESTENDFSDVTNEPDVTNTNNPDKNYTDKKDADKEDSSSFQVKEVSWTFKTNGGISSSPIIHNNTIYFGSKDGNLYAVELDTNTQLWHFNSNGPILCKPTIHNDTIFFSSNEVYYAVNIITGEKLWSYDADINDTMTTRKDKWDYHDSSPVVSQDIVFFGSGLGYVYGFNVTTGELVWEYETIDRAIVRHTPLIHNGILYIGDWKGVFYAIDMNTNSSLWTQKFSGSFHGSTALYENTLFIGGRDSKIHSLDSTTGAINWSYPAGSWASGEPLLLNDIVYFPVSDAKVVYATNIDKGVTLKKYRIYKNSFSQAVIKDNILYVTSGDAYDVPGTGKLQAYDLEGNGQPIWEVSIDTGAIYTTPVIHNGVIYFGSEDGTLYGTPIN